MDASSAKKLASLGASVIVNQVPIQWNDNNQGFKFFGVESIIFWQKPSLIAMLQPLQEELGEMAGSVSHEINTPLAVISLLSEQLLEKLNPNSLEYKSAKTIFATTTKISKIIQGLKAFSRNAAQDPFVLTPVQVIIEDTRALCQTRFQNSGINVQIPKIAANLTLDCRATQLSQVLLNLLNNAFDAVSELSEKWIRIDVTEVNEHILIRLTDSGRGISPNILDKIMSPFFTTKPSGVGTGLGLSISKDIAETHGGQLYYDDKVKNTCFVLAIPRPSPGKE